MRLLRTALLCVIAALCPLALSAQNTPPPGFVTVYQSRLSDSNGNLQNNATMCARAVGKDGSPISVQAVGPNANSTQVGAITVTRPVCAAVNNGAWWMYLPNSATSNPLNASYRLSVTDNVTGETTLLNGYGNVQPSFENVWCANSQCNLDNLPPNQPAQTLVQVGPQGAKGDTGATGCLVGQPQCTNLVPTSVGAVQLADQAAGGDIGAKINAAFADAGGGAGTPSRGAKVILSPGKKYQVTTQIVIPSQASAPYVMNPTLDCQGSELVWSGPDSQPIIVVTPDAALNAANAAGAVMNCTLTRNNNGPALQYRSRSGFKLENIDFNGGNPELQGVSTNTAVVSSANFSEETQFTNLGFHGCGGTAISLEQDPTSNGSGSFLYTWWERIKFDLDGDCHTGMHIAPNVGIFGGRMDFQFNIGGGSADYHMLTNDGSGNGSLASTDITISGEPTGAPTGTVYMVDGSSYSAPTLHDIYRGAHSFGAIVQSSGYTGCNAGGENPFIARNSLYCPGKIYLANIGGSLAGMSGELDAAYQIVRSITANPTDHVENMPKVNLFAAYSDRNALGFGPGYLDSSSFTLTGDTTSGNAVLQNVAGANALWKGAPVSGAGILAGTTVVSMNLSDASHQTVTLSQPATASATGVTLTVQGGPPPQFTIETHGSIGSTPYPNNQTTVGGESQYGQWEGGSYLQRFVLPVFPGQASAHYIQKFQAFDVNNNPFVNGWDCNEQGGAVNCLLTGSLQAGTISTGQANQIGTTCTVGGYITLTVDGVARKVATCQ